MLHLPPSTPITVTCSSALSRAAAWRWLLLLLLLWLLLLLLLLRWCYFNLQEIGVRFSSSCEIFNLNRWWWRCLLLGLWLNYHHLEKK